MSNHGIFMSMNDLFSQAPVVIKADASGGFAKWLTLAKTLLPGVHPGRHNEWSLSRYALEQKMKALGGPEIFGMDFDGFQKIKDHPEWIFSMSHTKEWAGAWVLKAQEGMGLGLDLELKDRKISHEIFQRMHNPDDINLNLVTQWAVKEAAYKSLPADIQDKLWLNSIKIKRGTFEVRDHTIRGEWTTFPHDQLVIAAALRL